MGPFWIWSRILDLQRPLLRSLNTLQYAGANDNAQHMQMKHGTAVHAQPEVLMYLRG